MHKHHNDTSFNACMYTFSLSIFFKLHAQPGLKCRICKRNNQPQPTYFLFIKVYTNNNNDIYTSQELHINDLLHYIIYFWSKSIFSFNVIDEDELFVKKMPQNVLLLWRMGLGVQLQMFMFDQGTSSLHTYSMGNKLC